MIILFVTVVASVILTNTAEMMKDKIDITIYFKPNTSEEVLAELTEKLEEDPNLKSIETATSEDEYKKFLDDSKTERLCHAACLQMAQERGFRPYQKGRHICLFP